MSIYQVFNILYARIWVIILTSLVTISTTSLIVMVMPEQYTATSSVILDVAVPDAVSGRTMPSGLLRDHINTQIRLIKSDRVALKVVESMDLTRSPLYLNAFADVKNEDIEFKNWIALKLMDNLDVRQAPGSSILTISFNSSSARYSAKVANAYTDAYIEVDLELRVDPAKRNAQWFSGQLNNLQQNLDDAQRRLTQYQQRTGIVSISETLDTETSKLKDLTARVTEAEADVSNARSLVKQLASFQKGQYDSTLLPDLLSNSDIQRWKDELSKIEAQFAMIAGSVGPNHPSYKATLAQRTAIQNQLDEEIGKLRTAILAQVTMTESKATSLDGELIVQKDKLLRLRSDRDELDSLIREVDIRKIEYDDAFRRAGTLRLEGAIAQTGVVVMSEAQVPQEHSFPQRRLSILLASAAGLMLGLALAFLLEMLDRRIRSAQDLEQSSGTTVYAVFQNSRKNIKKSLKKAKKLKASAPRQIAAQ